jgi:serine/threonine protein kinase
MGTSMQRQARDNDTELTIIRHPHQDSSELSEKELARLWELVAEHPDDKIYQDDQLACTVLRFNENTYVALGKHIGQGFWGQVELGTLYQRQADGQVHHQKCVIKSIDKSNQLKNILHTIVNTSGLMSEESELVKKVYGLGECLNATTSDQQDTQTYILQPYLGDMTLAKLLQKPETIAKIPCKQWITLFIKLVKKLDELHSKTQCLHNDIKPDNIGISLSEDGDELRFTQVNFFDLGNAHIINGIGSFGDPRYQPLESYLGVVLPGIKNEKVDISALGITLLETIDCLLKSTDDKNDIASYTSCKNLFQQMPVLDPASRLSLSNCHQQLLHIRKIERSTLAQFEIEESKDSKPSSSMFNLSYAQTFFQRLWNQSSTQPKTDSQKNILSLM